jgi:hypothetical protein
MTESVDLENARAATDANCGPKILLLTTAQILGVPNSSKFQPNHLPGAVRMLDIYWNKSWDVPATVLQKPLQASWRVI